jgi:hypothetical protein
LFTDEKYFSLEGVFNRQNERAYAVNRSEADEQGGISQKSKYPKRITLSHQNYIEVVLPHAKSEDERLLGDDFIYQQANATPHTHKKSLAWCEESFVKFINNERWPPNSPDLNVLDYYVWNAVTNAMQWDKVKNYDSLIEEI